MISRSAWVTGAVLAIAVIAGFAVRLAPCLRHPEFEFIVDGRYHQRLTAEVRAHGRLAAVDALCNAPDGRRTASFLPVGLYYAGAAFERALAPLGLDSRWSLAVLGSLAGALIALPAALAGWALFRDRRAAAIAGLLAVFVPAHLARTTGITLRYDALGVLLVTAQAALALAALREPRAARRGVLALASALALAGALSVWRVSLVVFQLELVALALVWLLRGPEREVRDLALALAAAAIVGCLPIAYLREQRFALSPVALAAAILAGLFALPRRGLVGRPLFRLVALAAAGALALAAGAVDRASDYAGIAGMVRDRLRLTGAPSADAALMLTVLELQSLGLLRLLTDRQVFGWMGAAFVLAPLLLLWLRDPRATAGALRPDAAITTTATIVAGLTVACLFFQRSAVLLAPWVAVLVAGVLARLWTTPVRRRAPRVALAAAVGLAAIAASASGIGQAAASRTELAPNLQRAIEYLRIATPPGAIVLCDWDAGYEVQARAGRATVVDGLLESTENRRRIIELDHALLAGDSELLEAMGRRYGATWLLLPNSSAIYAMAAVAGDPLAPILARGEAVPRGPLTDKLVVHLIEGTPEYPALRRALESGGYTVFEIVRR